MKQPFRTTSQEIERMIELRKSGLSIFEVFVESDRSFETVYRKVKHVKPKAPVKNGRKKTIDYKQVHQLKAKGLTNTEIANRLNISDVSVWSITTHGCNIRKGMKHEREKANS
jgi:orotate phosphoribosyltransferase-like protein